MLFNSWEFVVLLVVTFGLFYAVPNIPARKCVQSIILLVASTVFYGWEDWRLLGLLAVSCGGNTFATVKILQHRLNDHERGVKMWVRLAVVLNLLLLGIFKYAGLVAGLFPFCSPEFVESVRSIPLPIGISFYTFHGISMVVDMSRGKVHAYDSLIRTASPKTVYSNTFRDMGLYLLFFPQLIAGPIIKAHYFWPQIKAKFFARIDWQRAFRYCVAGYFFKMVVADNLAPVTNVLQSSEYIASQNGVTLLLMLFGYSMQIFADFGGYSMIAIGLAALFGYRFPINFNFPYISTSLTHFWQRWNMTLSAWLRDYLYIPLGGNRKGPCRTYLNLFLVMFLGGLWHGADWKFALWGTMHGLFLAAERFLGNRPALASLRIPSLVKIVYCFTVVACLWTTFLMPDINTVFLFFKQVWTNFACSPADLLGNMSVYSVCLFGSLVVLYHVYGWIKEYRMTAWNGDMHYPRLFGVLYGAMIFLIVTNSGPQCGFVYFQF